MKITLKWIAYSCISGFNFNLVQLKWIEVGGNTILKPFISIKSLSILLCILLDKCLKLLGSHRLKAHPR